MTDLISTASAQTTAEANLVNQPLTGFAKQFAAFDAEIMAELGDDRVAAWRRTGQFCFIGQYPGKDRHIQRAG